MLKLILAWIISYVSDLARYDTSTDRPTCQQNVNILDKLSPQTFPGPYAGRPGKIHDAASTQV